MNVIFIYDDKHYKNILWNGFLSLPKKIINFGKVQLSSFFLPVYSFAVIARIIKIKIKFYEK